MRLEDDSLKRDPTAAGAWRDWILVGIDGFVGAVNTLNPGTKAVANINKANNSMLVRFVRDCGVAPISKQDVFEPAGSTARWLRPGRCRLGGRRELFVVVLVERGDKGSAFAFGVGVMRFRNKRVVLLDVNADFSLGFGLCVNLPRVLIL